MNTFVAIVIPTLNEEIFIAGVIDSLINQSYTFADIDLMIVDGGSSDATCQIVEKYVQKYPNIRLLKNPKRIQSAAFNIAIKESSAPYLIRLDAHAKYNKDYVKYCVERLSSLQNIGNVGGCCIIEPGANTLVGQANAIVNKVKFGIGGASFRVGADAGDVDTVPFGAFPRSVLEQVGGMREDLPRGEDNEFNSRIRRYGYRIFLDPRILCTYYSRPTFLTACRQMYANGLSIGHLLRVSPHSVGLRHLVPCAFMSSLICSLALSILIPEMLWCMSGILALYLVADLCATILACVRYGWKYLYVLPVLFFCVHISYGWGTIIGLLKKNKNQ